MAQLFRDQPDNPVLLADLRQELSYRTTGAARVLLEEIENQIILLTDRSPNPRSETPTTMAGGQTAEFFIGEGVLCPICEEYAATTTFAGRPVCPRCRAELR
jgi:hypothetical protein